MNPNHRFNRDEISKILKHAAELEHKDQAGDDSEGLTLQELEQVSADVGINPKYIQQALDELKTGDQPVTSNLIGGPFTYNFSTSTRGILKEENWEDVVSEIRRIHGGIGKTGKLGNTFEWEQRKREVGYIQISLAPKKDQTKISINANYRYYAFVVSVLSGIGCIPLFTFLANTFSGSPFAPILVFGPILVLIAGVRFYLSRWMKKKRKIYNRLFDRFQKMLTPDEEKKDTSSIEIPEEEQHQEIKRNTRSGRQRTS